MNTMSPADPSAEQEKTHPLRHDRPRRGHHGHPLLDLGRPNAGHPAAVRPRDLAGSNRTRARHALLRGAHDAQAHHGLPLLRQARHQLAQADHLRRRSDALRGRLPRHRSLHLRPHERLRPDREHVVAHLPRSRRPPHGRNRGAERQEAAPPALRRPPDGRRGGRDHGASPANPCPRAQKAKSASAAPVS